jgi:hypothetical protein
LGGAAFIVLIRDFGQLIDLVSDRIGDIPPLPKSTDQLKGNVSLLAVKVTLEV